MSLQIILVYLYILFGIKYCITHVESKCIWKGHCNRRIIAFHIPSSHRVYIAMTGWSCLERQILWGKVFLHRISCSIMYCSSSSKETECCIMVWGRIIYISLPFILQKGAKYPNCWSHILIFFFNSLFQISVGIHVGGHRLYFLLSPLGQLNWRER